MAAPEGLILPTLTLVIAVTPYVARIMRASMIEVLESDYVEMARLKGLPERLVIRRHALPNALGPTLPGDRAQPGLPGRRRDRRRVRVQLSRASAARCVTPCSNRDLPVVQALAMLIAALYVVLNLLADIATILVTPRLRTRI